MLCDDCEGEILATEEDNASLKEVKVCLTWDNIVCNILCNYCKADDAGKPSDWLVEGGELGFADSHSRLGHTPAPPPLPGLLHSLHQSHQVTKVIITFLLLIQTWNAGSVVGQINQGQGPQQVRLVLAFDLVVALRTTM